MEQRNKGTKEQRNKERKDPTNKGIKEQRKKGTKLRTLNCSQKNVKSYSYTFNCANLIMHTKFCKLNFEP